MSDPAPNLPQSDFLAAADHQEQRGLVRELIGFMRENKAWWMAPILGVLGLLAVLLVLGTTGVLPFTYVFF